MKNNQAPRVRGFKFAFRPAGIKSSAKADLGLIYSEVPAACAGVFTRNQVVAAPVVISRPRIAGGRCQAVVVNSGNANACTGDRGIRDALRMTELTAHTLGLSEDLVVVSSTGVIGQTLPMARLEKHIPLLGSELVADGAEGLAEAIRTTDSFAKLSWRELDGCRVLGIAKGAGMIHPNMATMLGFVVSDARIDAALLQQLLVAAVDRSFNAITVDGDTSTNDMVLVLANGQGEGDVILPGSSAAEQFSEALKAVLLDLAKMIVRDGEGATKLVEIAVRGAESEADARAAARSIATSSLVKTAFFGEDANWGRIIAAAGYSEARVDPNRVAIDFDRVPVVRAGVSTGAEREAEASEVLRRTEFRVTVDLGLGAGCFSYYTSDLTYDYVKINADYRT
ncbi:ornithine acetyltransferase [Geothermobacter hydrogeniphilus]|uniref:Arginine biosynthesis bifunctional protein ArgJ n=1 Tax=Geothermobacter hydrogeniphilus TaxID=1969733 RepID=A0A2K2H8E8_9BACT|nr:bifunctional glutamate N-acetyltransferase/amino-acid acetyltransferase ArgJ [Geothermobacter hydrogeniphilus]PNU19503.1 ornithine acetyltransferase [Geothermobacter hydrogeniphilus]